MSDDSSTRRLSQIFGSLSCLTDQQLSRTQHPPTTTTSSRAPAASPPPVAYRSHRLDTRPLPPPPPQSLLPRPHSGQYNPQLHSDAALPPLRRTGSGKYPGSGVQRLAPESQTRSTPNSPRMVTKRQRVPPPPAATSSTHHHHHLPPPPPSQSAAAMMANPALLAFAGCSDNKYGSELEEPQVGAMSPAAWSQFSALTEHLDVRQINNYAQVLPEINWQERCLELQLELHRTKNMSGRQQDTLRNKLSELEQRVIEAEERANDAEDKVRVMEQRLTEQPPGTPSSASPAHHHNPHQLPSAHIHHQSSASSAANPSAICPLNANSIPNPTSSQSPPQTHHHHQQQQQQHQASHSNNGRAGHMTTTSSSISSSRSPTPLQSSMQSPAHQPLQHPTNTCSTDTEKTITQLEVQVEEQRLLRLQDAKQVEEKAAKIKEWVTNKLRELEEQNQVLREQNVKCNQQLQLLRNHLTGRSSGGAASAASGAAGVAGAGGGVVNPSLRYSYSLDGTSGVGVPHVARAQTTTTSPTTSIDSLDQPQSLPLPPLLPAHGPSSRHSGHVQKQPQQPPHSLPANGSAHHHHHHRRSHRRIHSMEPHELARDLAAAVDGLQLTPLSSLGGAGSNASLLTDAGGGYDIPAGGGGGYGGIGGAGTDATHDYAEIYTPVREMGAPVWPVKAAAAAGAHPEVDDGSGGAVGGAGKRRPPTPPLHRFPSWEAKIYQVASDGLAGPAEAADADAGEVAGPAAQAASAVQPAEADADGDDDDYGVVELRRPPPASASANGGDANIDGDEQQQQQPSTTSRMEQTASGGYCDINVPVYATVKGDNYDAWLAMVRERASQIRSVPFSGDSSDDSSDADDHTGHHHHPHHHHQHHQTAGAVSTVAGAGPTSTAGATVGFVQPHNPHHSTSTENTETSTSGSASSPSKSLKHSSSLSPAKRSGSQSPKIPKTRNTSFESAMSDDYAIPPDAQSQSEATGMDASMPSLLMRTSYADSPNRKMESLEKIGHLAKLGGKLKTWRKRWFVLKNGSLTYWKSQNDVNRKPQGQITLDECCRINRADGASTFEIDTGKKIYYLTADSHATMDDWIRVLQNVQRRNATKLLLSRDDQKPTVQGWVTKVKNGHSKRCWCVLLGKMFLYFKAPGESNPLGQINMRDARVEEVEHVSDSDSEEHDEHVGQTQARLTVAIYPAHQGPTYLILPGKQERDNWLYCLTVVSGGGLNAGTQYEQLVQKLMETDGDPNCPMWRHPILLHTKDQITSPLSTLHSELLQAEAIKLFKSCLLFMSVAINQPGVDYHVILAQNALQQCQDMPELQSELICTLIKQTSRHTSQKLGAGVQVNKRLGKQTRQLLLCATQSLFTCDTQQGQGGTGQTNGCSPTSIQMPIVPPIDCKSNPPAYTFVQGWQLLALAVSLFIPKNNRLLWYLKLHLSRYAIDTKTECGKYAAYCERALERTIRNGSRETKPSRMEVLSILTKNPYQHSLPHAIPVHMPNTTYQVFSFDGSTTIEEFQTTLAAEIGCRPAISNGFCLFSDDPIERDLEHYLDPQAKLCDVIAKWETALREKGSGKFENSRVIQLTYKNRLYWRHSAKLETDKEKLLLCYQTSAQIVQGRFPLSRELALELASLMAQIDIGDYAVAAASAAGPTAAGAASSSVSSSARATLELSSLAAAQATSGGTIALQALDRFYPYRYRDPLQPEQLKSLQDSLVAKWTLLKTRSTLDCVRIYLTCCRKWPFFGSALFQAKRRHADQAVIWLACAEDALNVLDLSSMVPVARYAYGSVMTFGGCQDDFMLVVADEPLGGTATTTTTTTTTTTSDEAAAGGGTAASAAVNNEAKLLFAMSKPKILEITLLIADYMNALGHTCPGTPQMNTLTRNGSHRSIRLILDTSRDEQLIAGNGQFSVRAGLLSFANFVTKDGVMSGQNLQTSL